MKKSSALVLGILLLLMSGLIGCSSSSTKPSAPAETKPTTAPAAPAQAGTTAPAAVSPAASAPAAPATTPAPATTATTTPATTPSAQPVAPMPQPTTTTPVTKPPTTTTPAPPPAPIVAKPATDGSYDRIKKAGKLLVAIDATYPPMEFVDSDGKTVIGFDVDMATKIAEKLGVKAEFVVMDWDGIIPGLLGKRYDMIMSTMNITPDRQKQVNFVEYAKMSQVFVSGKGNNIRSEADLAGKLVAVQAETTSQDWLESVKETAKFKDMRTFKAATDTFLEVKNGRADVIVIDEPVGRYYARLDSATFTVTGQAMDPEPVGIAIRKEDVDLAKAVDQAYTELMDSGTVAQISWYWFGIQLPR